MNKKRILSTTILFVVGVLFLCVLFSSNYNEKIQFVHIANQNTGQNIGAMGSLFLYFMLWCLVGLVPSAFVMLITLLMHRLLYRKDDKSEEQEEVFHYSGKLAFISTYIATAVLVALHAFNVIAITL